MLATVTTQTEEQKNQAVKSQRVALLAHNKKEYNQCMKDAGMQIICKFTPEQAAGLKKEMSFQLWRLVKRAIKQVRRILSFYHLECSDTET